MFALYLRNWLKCQRGQDLIEYALLAGLIAVAATAAIISTGGSVETLFSAVAGAVGTAASSVGQ